VRPSTKLVDDLLATCPADPHYARHLGSLSMEPLEFLKCLLGKSSCGNSPIVRFAGDVPGDGVFPVILLRPYPTLAFRQQASIAQRGSDCLLRTATKVVP